jgi:glyoxylate reductase
MANKREDIPARPAVVVVGAFDQGVLDEARRMFDLAVITAKALGGEEGSHVLSSAVGMLAPGDLVVDESLLERAPNLSVVSLRSVGYDKVDLAACRRRGVAVYNTPGVLDAAVAELVILLMLAVARRLPANMAAACGGWYETGTRPPLGLDIRGRTLGIVGMGRIGRMVGTIAHQGFGMNVLYHSRTRHDDVGFATWVERDDLFRRADVISLHVPLTPDTRHVVGVRELRLMGPQAILINTSRGAVVDEAALVEALRNGEIAGAGLDVVENEPLPPDHPLTTLPNVVLTPHIGSATTATRAAMARLSLQNLQMALAGTASPHRVM